MNNSTQNNDTECIYDSKMKDIHVHMAHFVLHVPVLVVIVFAGLITNALAFVILGKEGRTKKTSPVFILRIISITDSFVLLMNLVKYALPEIFQFTGRLGSYFEFSMLASNAIWFSFATSKVFSIYLVILMTTDRWLACCRPLHARSWCTRKNAAIATVLILIFSIVFSLPKLWTYEVKYVFDKCTNRLRPKSNLSTTFFHPIYLNLYVITGYFLVYFLVPMLSIIIMNYMIVRAVRRSAGMRTCGNTNSQQDIETIVTKRAVLVALAFFVLEGPSILFHIVTMFYKKKGLLITWLPILYDLSAINNCVNFFLYCLVGKKFRSQLKDLCYAPVKKMKKKINRDRRKRQQTKRNGHHVKKSNCESTCISRI
ncbi:FMRFamide receptor-like [Tubulanus polymorphus]|uniref:FMRFamide receptor-like n=1 Tax=Tubulanus polymorphus TaxID=672921 RepID=UPI003DA41E1A